MKNRSLALAGAALSLSIVFVTCSDDGDNTVGGDAGVTVDGATGTGDGAVSDGPVSQPDANIHALDAMTTADASVTVDAVIPKVIPKECDTKPPKMKLTLVTAAAKQPMAMAQPKGETRFYVAERAGRIMILENGNILPTPFLDMRTSIALFVGAGEGKGERGLTSLVFHPDYATNGRFFVFYTRSVTDPYFVATRHEGDVVIAEGHRSAADPLKADVMLKELIAIRHDGADGRPRVPGCCDDGHNGGFMVFRKDGYLYAGVGDGGSAAAMYLAEAPGLGKILRLDVDNPGVPPAGNMTGSNAFPFAWAEGVRNPWRGSIDPKTGDLYFVDVGEGAWEEVNYIAANQTSSDTFGWKEMPAMEGTREVFYFNYMETGAAPYGVLPIFEYEHPIIDPNPRFVRRGSRAITGGAVYRGASMPSADGRFFFGDYVENQVYSILLVNGVGECFIDHTADLVTVSEPFVGFSGVGQAQNGELYLFALDGHIYLLDKE
jgi:glucose/arabinose dehydrogenase